MEDAERHGYEMLDPDTPTHMPTDVRHRLDVLNTVLGHRIRRPMHVEVVPGLRLSFLHRRHAADLPPPPASAGHCVKRRVRHQKEDTASKGGYGTNADYISWEATIDRANESATSLNQLCRQLTKATAPKCSITDRSGIRFYDAKA
ncbi:hypothetical protein EVAR_89434_1 [Eumeta japonica]|uniref:Uncharacterized protein n=1 Tax=Eumeta variegata TaxID=151549 RepID=A0A4C1Z656_EUMVA|nr:hypothetical protein EVAR_89434_1 [Eumeta japonica]